MDQYCFAFKWLSPRGKCSVIGRHYLIEQICGNGCSAGFHHSENVLFAPLVACLVPTSVEEYQRLLNIFLYPGCITEREDKIYVTQSGLKYFFVSLVNCKHLNSLLGQLLLILGVCFRRKHKSYVNGYGYLQVNTIVEFWLDENEFVLVPSRC